MLSVSIIEKLFYSTQSQLSNFPSYNSCVTYLNVHRNLPPPLVMEISFTVLTIHIFSLFWYHRQTDRQSADKDWQTDKNNRQHVDNRDRKRNGKAGLTMNCDGVRKAYLYAFTESVGCSSAWICSRECFRKLSLQPGYWHCNTKPLQYNHRTFLILQ